MLSMVQMQRLHTPSANFNVKIMMGKSTGQTQSDPCDPSQDGQQRNDRNKIPRDYIGYPFDGGPSRLTFSDNFNDIVKPEFRY
jgi:hypothetical protein